MTDAQPTGAAPDRLEQAGYLAVVGVAATLQFSIAAAETMLAISAFCWLALIISRRERFEVPRPFLPIGLYCVLTLLSAAFSPHPAMSLLPAKQLVLFALIPIVYRFVPGRRALLMVTVVLSVAAASAAFGIFQYGILHYDNLGQRPQGTLGHYMTYSGLLMLVIGVALARILFDARERTWAALVMPALAVAVALTFTRSAWVGACAGAAMLFSLKDFRLLAVLPVLAAVFFSFAPSALTARFVSMFDLKDPTNRDRVAMLREGEHMIRTHPLLGIGPNMVRELYAEYRDPEAVEAVNPHLHNVPMQIAAERGLPAVASWVWFIGALTLALARLFRQREQRFLAAAALAAVVSMLAAGMFEYNFGDSEFLMLFLILVTLPFAAARGESAARAAAV